MINSINTLGHQVSAVVGSVIHARSKKIVRMKAIATGTLLVGVFMLSTSNLAMAGGQSLEAYSQTVSKNTNVVVDIVAYVCYLSGAVLSALGIVDLKKHVEQPTNNPLKNGLAKLGFGGILLGLPFLSGVMLETMKGTGGEAQYQDFTRSGLSVQ